MHFLRSGKIRHAIAFGLGAAIGTIYFMSALTANADAGISVAGNGQAIVRGAKVLHISGNEILAQTEWGTAKIPWRIVISGSTRFTPARDHEDLINDIKVGEMIAFSGLMDQRSKEPTILASMVRNETVIQSATVVDGSVIGFDTNGLVVDTENGTSTIRVSTGTIMTKDGNRAYVDDLVPGETVKAFGTFNKRSRVLDAQRIVSVSFPNVPNTGAPEKHGVIASILGWLKATGGALSLR